MSFINTEHKALFHLAYDSETKNYDEVLAKLDKTGASRYDCVMLLTQELNITASEANNIVYNSPVWEKLKSSVGDVFSGFFDFCETVKD